MKFVPSLLAASICSAVFAASAAVPVVTDTIAKNAELMNADPAMQALLKEATSEEAQKWRFNTLLELARIASPSRFEMRRQAEITRRLVGTRQDVLGCKAPLLDEAAGDLGLAAF